MRLYLQMINTIGEEDLEHIENPQNSETTTKKLQFTIEQRTWVDISVKKYRDGQ